MKKGAKKDAYFGVLKDMFNKYPSVFLVNIENVSSNQIHQIRTELRKINAHVLMGKNTMVRTGMRSISEENSNIDLLIEKIRGNVGFVFTDNSDLKLVRDKIIENRVRAPARAGAIAPLDVVIPAGNTGMEPGKTSFFQALGVPTKIARGTIEIINDVHLVKQNSKVGNSEAVLLNMLNISPFTYGMTIAHIFDNGSIFHPDILDIDENVISGYIQDSITRIAAFSLATEVPSIAAIPHLIINNYKKVLAVSIESDYTFEASQKVKDYLADPSAFAAPEQVQTDKPAAKKEEAKKEEPEESDEDMGFGLFD